eukprot:c346_g1_i1.p1 GENE.c346_g1_i1~~c346_g1_i1.p1  ORF type:complete len:242 (-),score=38.13 c346_g1_i1:73-798(-)
MSQKQPADTLAAQFTKTRNQHDVFRPCCRMLAGLQHIVDWKLSHNSHPEHFRYTLGALMHSIENLSEADQLIVIAYFYVFVKSIYEGEKIKFRSSRSWMRVFGKRKHEIRLRFCAEIIEYIMNSLPFSHFAKPLTNGPFPRLTSMELPVFLPQTEPISQPRTTTESLLSLKAQPSLRELQRTSSFTFISSARVITTLVKWLHGRTVVPHKKYWVTDKIFNSEIQELNEVMARWTQIGLSNQ